MAQKAQILEIDDLWQKEPMWLTSYKLKREEGFLVCLCLYSVSIRYLY